MPTSRIIKNTRQPSMPGSFKVVVSWHTNQSKQMGLGSAAQSQQQHQRQWMAVVSAGSWLLMCQEGGQLWTLSSDAVQLQSPGRLDVHSGPHVGRGPGDMCPWGPWGQRSRGRVVEGKGQGSFETQRTNVFLFACRIWVLRNRSQSSIAASLNLDSITVTKYKLNYI